jgi:hypothetical protein
VLETTDPSITIIDGSTIIGDVAPGEVVDTGADPFAFEVAADAPTGSIVELSLRAIFTGGETPSELALVIGKFDYLVWDPTGDQSSGPTIAATLEGWHYIGTSRDSLPLDRLDDYASLWVSCGMYPENFVVESTGPEGPAIVAFMAAGGSVYLEGGDIWAFDPQWGGYDFRPHFGIDATQDGSGDLVNVVGVTGQFSEGMNFVYAGENSYVDRLNPTAHGFAVLSNTSPAYHCGVAGDTGTYRTVGTSFELAGLLDGGGVSTKASLVRAVMDFFGIAAKDIMFGDDFESGNCDAWSVMVP